MHYFEQFNYCPCCGQNYASSDFDNNEIVFRCPQCHYEFYQNGTPAATALIPHAENPDHILLITRNTPPNEGLLALPGGLLRYGELPQDAVVREVREETLLDIEPQEILQTSAIDYHYKGRQVFVVETCFLCTPVSRDISQVRTDEASSIGYFPAEQLINQPDKLAFPEHAGIFSKYLGDLSVGGT